MIKVISYGKHKNTVQICVISNGRSQTKHLRLEHKVWMDKTGKQYDL